MDSKTLFAKQIELHAQTLCELLSCPGGEAPPADIMDRAILGTRMLAGTSGLMGLEGWAELWSVYQHLLERYRDGRHPWEERIADVTSELIEREESVTGSIQANPDGDLVSLFDPEELLALISEIAALEEECDSLPTLEEVPAQPAATPEAPVAAAPVSGDAPMQGVVFGLRASFDKLQSLFVGGAWSAREWDAAEITDIHRELSTISFFTGSLESAIRANANGGGPTAVGDLEPLRVAVADFAAELSRDGQRRVTVTLDGHGHGVDPAMLPVADGILRSMIRDVHACARSESVEVRVDVEERNGALRWRVSDSGDNFVSDSAVDHEDQLAFYRNLRSTMHALERVHGVLWVEPDGGREARFEFTLPVNESPAALLWWGDAGSAFAVWSSQVCDVVPASSARQDALGECVHADGRRVPLVRMDAIYDEAPRSRDMIAILGSVERRIAFYVPGAGTRSDSPVFSDSIPVWRGAPQLVAQLDDRRVPLFEAANLLETYMALTGTLQTEPISGGVPDDHSASVRSQATSKADATAPPESSSDSRGERRVVLVVEQSQSMRDTLTEMLAGSEFDCQCVSDVDEAMERVQNHRPDVIVSEFRMPTMAARRVVESLQRGGLEVPVLVTTSQTGQTAELLVHKLGAAGYLTKPLDAAAVTARIGETLGARVDS